MINPTLEGWVIVISNGLTFLGRPTITAQDGSNVATKMRLAPVYTMAALIGPKPDNPREQDVVYMVQPVHLLSSIQGITVPEGAIVIEMNEVSIEERKYLARFVGIAEQLSQKIRLARTGLVTGH